MDDRKAASPGLRVVVLSRDPSLGVCADGERAEVACVRAASAYEAAAEILAAPAAMLVVDLPSLGKRNARLVEIARQMGLEIVGVGRLPAGMEAAQLAGVRLMGRDELDQAIQALTEQHRVTPAPEPVEAGEPAPQPETAHFEPVDVPQTLDAEQTFEEDLAYLEEPAQAEPPPETSADRQYKAEAAAQADDGHAPADAEEATPAPTPASAEGLLTPEELSALLENEP